MTKFKKIIPALCMLLISAVLMGTSTYAWFSMNTQVSVKGMQVTANSTNLFLQISSSATYTDPATSVDYNETTGTKLKPATPVLAAENASIEKWQTATSNDPSKATSGADTTIADIVAGSLSEYVYSKELHFRIAPNSTATATNLVIAGVTMTGDNSKNLNKALRVAVAGAAGVQVWTYADGTWKVDTSKTAEAILATVTTTDATAKLYIWFEGTDENCTTNNAANLDTLTFTVTFSVTAANNA